MSRRLVIITIITVVLFVVILGLVGYFSYLNIAYVDTLHARVDGAMMQVRVPAVGRLVEMPLEIGDAVAEHEELAILETAAASAGAQSSISRMLVPVRAPMAGIIADKTVHDGDVLTAGQTIATLVDPEQIWITANVHETRIAQVHVGQLVRIKIRNRTLRRTFWGRVEQVGRATNVALSGGSRGVGASASSPAEVPVRISVDPAGYTLYPGMTADVRIKLSPRSLRQGATPR
jgi:multidrug resistance efflux pump